MPRFLRPLQPLRIAGYYDLQPGAVIYDAAGGTLALVEHILPTANGTAIRSALDQAASIRQLLLEQAELESRSPQGHNSRKLALQVELVILTEAPTPQAETPLRQVLTDIARETGYVRLIGIGVLQPDLRGEFSDAALRRAFPWLLTAARKWFQRPDYAHAENRWRDPGEAFEVRLRDYRIAGTRRLRCDGECNLRIVHGHNGSGKSAITEAIELLLTHGVQRLEEGGETNYFSAVRHRPAGTDDITLATMPPAEVSFWKGGAVSPPASPVASVVVDPGEGKTHRPRTGASASALLRANSFRLDQIFMDRIVRNRPEQRGGTFLEAFSPSDIELLPKIRATRKAVDEGIAALPQQIAAGMPTEQTLQYDWVIRHFGWLRAPDAATGETASPSGDPALHKTALEAVLPMPVDELKILIPLYEPLGDLVEAVDTASTREALVAALGQFDEKLKPLIAQLPTMLKHLRVALSILEEFKTWSAERRPVHGDSFKTELDSWLEALAAHDLALKGRRIAAAVYEAGQHGWHAPAEDAETVQSLQAESLRQHLDARVDALFGELNEARSRLQAWLNRETSSQASPAAAPPKLSRRHSLAADQIASLNLVGHWLPAAGCKDGLGVAFQNALTRSQQVSLTRSTIGTSGGLDPAISEARSAIAACERLQSSTSGSALGASARLQKLSDLVAAVDSATALGKDLPNSFFQVLAGSDSSVLNDLIAAFNELLALMTPARWTYRDIQLGVQMSTGEASMKLTTHDGARADLLFNTAELNAWTLTLFLLLAPRLPNPLYLLVLDDPMQNMDELTVISVARALSRLTRIYPPGWQILAFFHGEDAIARVLDETQAVVYKLPWMQPTTSSSDEPIDPVHTPEKWPPDLQQLTAKFLASPSSFVVSASRPTQASEARPVS
jgi:hypothetical protein